MKRISYRNITDFLCINYNFGNKYYYEKNINNNSIVFSMF